MGGAVYTPKQQNWHWYSDALAEPTAAQSLANEDVKPTLPDNTSIIRLRVCINETGGKADNNVVISLEYSTNDVDFTAFGSANHWNYANGLGTEGSTVTTQLLSDATTKNEYCESGTNAVAIGASTANELDIAVQPTATVSTNTTYYFRIVGDGTAIPLNTSKTHPQVLTTVQNINGTATISGGGALNGTGQKGGKGTGFVSGAGTLIAVGIAAMIGIASISAGGAQTAAGQKAAAGAIVISGGGELSGAATRTASGAASVSGNGAQAVIGLKGASDSVVISASGELVSAGEKSASSAAAISGNGDIAAAAAKQSSGSAAVTGGGTLIATGSPGGSSSEKLKIGGDAVAKVYFGATVADKIYLGSVNVL